MLSNEDVREAYADGHEEGAQEGDDDGYREGYEDGEKSREIVETMTDEQIATLYTSAEKRI